MPLDPCPQIALMSLRRLTKALPSNMTYCINPDCNHPQNPDDAVICRACGAKLLLRDRYQAIQPLGQGGFGATFLSRDRTLPGNPVCVIKELRPKVTEPHILEMSRNLFEREAKTLGKIGNHPQVPRLLDYFEWNQQFYLVQEYVNGSTLKDEVKKFGAFTEEEVTNFLCAILPILEYIHSQKVIHRDIKPANIIRRQVDGNLVLIDFGAVKDQVTQTTISATTGETVYTNYAIGTSGFAPIEQIRLRPVYASDIYAVGATCVYLLTAKSPGSIGEDPSTGKLQWRSHVSINAHLGEVLDKMLEPLVGRRYQSAAEVLRALNMTPTAASDLSDSLVSKPKTGGQPEEPTVFNSDDSWMSPFSSMAQTIRTRKGNNPAPSPPRSQNHTQIQQNSRLDSASASRSRSTSRSKTPPARQPWNAKTIVNAYHKGARDFEGCNLTGQNLANARLSGANLYGATLNRANFQGADLSGVQFGPATLIQTVLRDANLSKAYFSTANLERADLRGADLTGAYLRSANLRGANLCGANLTDAIITDDQLAMAKTNWWTIRPDGKRGFGF